MQDAFEFIAKYFENSLRELAARNPGIEGRFRRIDANRFTAVAYRDGDAIARCSIALGSGPGLMSGITYSHHDSTSTTSFNESLSVENDDQAIYFGALGYRRTDVQQNGFERNTNMIPTKDTGLTFSATLSNPFPDGLLSPVGAALGPSTMAIGSTDAELMGPALSWFREARRVERFFFVGDDYVWGRMACESARAW